MSKNNKIILAIVLVAVLIIGIVIFRSCEDNNHDGAAIKYVDSNDNVTESVSPQLMSLLIAGENYNNSALLSYLDTPIDESGTTVGDLIVVEACATGEELLCAEFLVDYVYGIGLSNKEMKTIETKMNDYISAYGSENEFNRALSKYGTDIEAVERYIILKAKHSKLHNYLYQPSGEHYIDDEELCNYFAKKYIIGDHIFLSFLGNVKDDGTVAPLSQEEIQQKKELGEKIYMELQSGVIDFDNAVLTYGEDSYKSMYTNGYFIPETGIAGLDVNVQSMLLSLAPGDIEIVETQSGIYIVRRNAMDKNLCLTVPEFAESLRSEMHEADFSRQLETADDGIKFDKDVIGKLDPASIPALDLSMTFGI